MKKTGFTLAEVLITLAIVGFIASITLPALNANTGEKQAAVALKKSLNSLTNAVQLSQVLDGVDLSQITEYKEFESFAKKRMSATVSTENHEGSSNAVFLLRDGISLITGGDDTHFEDNATIKTGETLPTGFVVTIDINGNNPPNKASECGDSDCSSGKKIYDRFTVKIRENRVIPNDSVTKWLIAQ